MTRILKYHLVQWALCVAAVLGALVSTLIPDVGWVATVAMLSGWTFGIMAGVRLARDVDSEPCSVLKPPVSPTANASSRL